MKRLKINLTIDLPVTWDVDIDTDELNVPELWNEIIAMVTDNDVSALNIDNTTKVNIKLENN